MLLAQALRFVAERVTDLYESTPLDRIGSAPEARHELQKLQL
jgi:hypothetical protein